MSAFQSLQRGSLFSCALRAHLLQFTSRQARRRTGFSTATIFRRRSLVASGVAPIARRNFSVLGATRGPFGRIFCWGLGGGALFRGVRYLKRYKENDDQYECEWKSPRVAVYQSHQGYCLS
jgi:hypothetical protein